MSGAGCAASRRTHTRRECTTAAAFARSSADARGARLSELLLRFEEPGSTVRWDSPLFVLPSGGDDEGMTDAETCLSGESGSSKLQATPAGGEPQGAGAASPTASACGALQAWEPAPLDAIWEAVSSGKTAKAPSVVAPVSLLHGDWPAGTAADIPASCALRRPITSRFSSRARRPCSPHTPLRSPRPLCPHWVEPSRSPSPATRWRSICRRGARHQRWRRCSGCGAHLCACTRRAPVHSAPSARWWSRRPAAHDTPAAAAERQPWRGVSCNTSKRHLRDRRARAALRWCTRRGGRGRPGVLCCTRKAAHWGSRGRRSSVVLAGSSSRIARTDLDVLLARPSAAVRACACSTL